MESQFQLNSYLIPYVFFIFFVWCRTIYLVNNEVESIVIEFLDFSFLVSKCPLVKDFDI